MARLDDSFVQLPRNRIATRQPRCHLKDCSIPQRRLLPQRGELTSFTSCCVQGADFSNSLQPLSVADFESPLTGPVFRMQRDLLVSGVDPANDRTDPDSEWKSLGTAGHLLSALSFSAFARYLNIKPPFSRADRRFGARRRPYLVHVAKAVSMPMLKELQTVFIDELTQVSRCSHTVSPRISEKLTSFIVYRLLKPVFEEEASSKRKLCIFSLTIRSRNTGKHCEYPLISKHSLH